MNQAGRDLGVPLPPGSEPLAMLFVFKEKFYSAEVTKPVCCWLHCDARVLYVCPQNGTLSKGMIKINLQRAHERRRKINVSHRLHGSFTSKVPVLHLSLYTKAQELVLTVLNISGHRCSI